MRKPALITIFAALTLVVLLLATYTFINFIELIAGCIYYSPQRPVRNTVIVGKVVKIENQGEWIVSDFRLCNTKPFNLARVKVFTPKNEAYVIVGEEKDKGGGIDYSWQTTPITKIDSILNKDNLLVIRIEEFNSKEQIENSFLSVAPPPESNMENLECNDIPRCKSRLEYFNTNGLKQITFLENLRNKKAFFLLNNFISGDSVIFSTEFGKVDSIERFRQLTEGLML